MLPAIAPTASATAAAHVHLCGAAGCGEAGEDKVSVDVSGTAEAPSPRSRPSGGRSKEKRVETGGGCRCGRAELLGLCSYGYPFLQSVFSSAPPHCCSSTASLLPPIPTPPRALCHAITHVGSAFSLFPFFDLHMLALAAGASTAFTVQFRPSNPLLHLSRARTCSLRCSLTDSTCVQRLLSSKKRPLASVARPSGCVPGA